MYIAAFSESGRGEKIERYFVILQCLLLALVVAAHEVFYRAAELAVFAELAVALCDGGAVAVGA